MLGVDEFVVLNFGRRFRLQIREVPQPLGERDRSRADHVCRLLRSRLEQADAEILQISRALGEKLLLLLPEPDAWRAAERPAHPRFVENLASDLADAIMGGRIAVEELSEAPLTERREELPELPPLPSTRREGAETFFEVRLVDEIGRAVSGVSIELSVDGRRLDVTTNAAGVALFESVKAQSGAATIVEGEAKAAEDALAPRWRKPRMGRRPKEARMTELVFAGDAIGPVSVTAAVPNTIVLTPPLGLIFVELWDKSGAVRHAGCDYMIDGPAAFQGKTDAMGRLRHEDILPGNYELTLSLTSFEDSEPRKDTYETQIVVLAKEDTEPEVRMLGVVPHVVLARLNTFFNTNKAFLLPTAFPSLSKLAALYRANPSSQLLVVGHADTAGTIAFNDQLSLERARATVAFLKDDVDGWLSFYGTDVEVKKRWGKSEDRMMLTALPDFVSKPRKEDGVRWFQRARGLRVDGAAGPQTRRQLITEYMALDDASLSAPNLSIEAIAHGCGEHFPLASDGATVDEAALDDQRDATDRRVELFFFEPEFGIVPAPPGESSSAGSTAYPTWRRNVIRTIELDAEDPEARGALFVEMAHAHFRTDSAVVLPEGEDPNEDEASGKALTSVGVIATVLRFNAEHPGKKLLVAGHTDSSASEGFNQKLSEERAQVALSLLVGDDTSRASFADLCHGRHRVKDYKQILAWIARASADFGLAFDCDPGAVDENVATGVEPVRRFQTAYNRNKVALNARAPDLAVDGDVGPLTWGAFFDCYELALRQELGEEPSGVQALRDRLEFVDDSRRCLGFSEYFPIEEPQVDDFRSQANRRAEFVLFDRGEEPDLEHAQADPETSEIYLPGVYVRRPVAVMSTARRTALSIQFLGDDGKDLGAITYRLELDDGTVLVGSSPNSTVEQVVSAEARSAKLHIDGAIIDIRIGDAA